MRPRFPFTYRHDLRSALTSRAIFAVAILTVLAGVSALVSVDSTTNSFPISGSAVFYYANGAYQVTGWAYDAAGAPVSGVVAEFSEVNTSSLNTSAGPYTVSTNGQGEFTL